MKAITPAEVKGAILLALAVVADLGLSFSSTLQIALLGSATLIAAVLTLAEAHIHVGVKVTTAIERALSELKGILPAINQLVAGLPGQVGAEVKRVLETVEKKPIGTEATSTTKVAKTK